MRTTGGSFVSSIGLFLFVGAAAGLGSACTGDQFRQAAEPPNGGAGGASGGSAGAGGKPSGGAAGAGGAEAGAGGTQAGAGAAGATGGGAGTSSAGAAGSAVAGAAGTTAGGAGTSAGAAGTSAGAGGKGGGGAGASAGAGGQAGAGGFGPIETAPEISGVTIYGPSCAGPVYATGTLLEAPQGAGQLCVELTGKLAAGDSVTIDGQPVEATFEAASSKLKVKWTVAPGGGLADKAVALVVKRTTLSSLPKALSIVARRVDASASESGPELGTSSAPYRSLPAAFATAIAGDGIGVLKLPKIADSTPAGAPFVIPAGLIVGRVGNGPAVSIVLERAIELGAGTGLVGLSLDCAKAGSTLGCVRVAGGGVTVSDVSISVGANAVAAIALTQDGAELSLTGGTLSGARGVLTEKKSARIVVHGTHFVTPDFGADGILMLDPGGATQTLEVGPGPSGPTTFSTGGSYVRASDVASATLTGIQGEGGEIGIDVSGTQLVLGAIRVNGAKHGARLTGAAVAVDGLVVDKPTQVGVTLGFPSTVQIKSLTVLDPGFTGVSIGGTVSIPGTLRVAWSTPPTGEPVEDVTGISTGGKVSGTGLIQVERSPGRGVRVSGGTFQSKPSDPANGLKILATLGDGLCVDPGGQVEADNAVFGQPVAGGGHMIHTKSEGAPLSVKLKTPSFDGTGSLEAAPPNAFKPLPEHFQAPAAGAQTSRNVTFAGALRTILWMSASTSPETHTIDFL